MVTLTPTPNPGFTFSSWGGACSGTGTCAPTVDSVKGVAATFLQSQVLSVTEAGNGTGVVTSNPAGINCSNSSNQCSGTFGAGSVVTLTASASSGSAFAGWSGGVCSGTGPCQVTLNAATTVTATFNVAITTNTLTINRGGAGSGTVNSNPSGIACGGTCTASFAQGTQVTLSGAADNGSTFAGWSGAGCSGIKNCTIALNADMTVGATFVQNTSTAISLVAAVLPASRSVQVGNVPATAFATIINAGPGDASTCSIAPAITVPASFDFQTTDPATNAVTGAANTPVDVAQGAFQTFVFAFTPTAPFAPTDVLFNFACANAAPASTILGVNTLNLSASASPVPDIVALAASADPGRVDIDPGSNAGAFAVATVNVGSSATITASADTGAANLPIGLRICQTDPSSGNCLSPPVASSLLTTIGANATPTFGIFVTGNGGAVPDMPAVNRVFVRFTDSGGVLRGETSVAVRTH